MAVEHPTLRALHLVSTDVEAAATFLATVCSTEVRPGPNGVEVPVGDAKFLIESSGAIKGHTVSALVIDRPGAEPATTELNGVNVVIESSAAPAVSRSTDVVDADVVLDHVAVLVTDLDAAAERWQTATGAAAEMIGLHPVSKGTLRAARLELGPRMIELISPVSGMISPLANRLANHGEGPFAIALPAIDLDAKRRHLDEHNIRTLWQEPHWLIHPANPARILIQLTPRVRH